METPIKSGKGGKKEGREGREVVADVLLSPTGGAEPVAA